MLDDTIVAISTPLGRGGIGIVRLSGKEAVKIASSIFKGKVDLSDVPSHTIHYGFILDKAKKVVDEVLVSVMRAPKTYTKEDVVEINCHGGIVALMGVLRVVLERGARIAQPGEFTKRAFLNGRIDLSQAEAVADIVKAQTEKSLKVALSQLEGGLSKKIKILRENLIEILAQIEARVDFVEGEEVEPLDLREIQKELSKLKQEIDRLTETAKCGSILREGVRTAIIGRPNVGKSSILNLLLGKKRSIVTDIPGTTRDTIEEIIDLDGIPLVVIDTAGVREGVSEIVEAEGVKRAWAALDIANLVLLVLDGSEPFTTDDLRLIEQVKDKEKETLIILNKIDLPLIIKPEDIKKLVPGRALVMISALKGEGLEELKEKIKEVIFQGKSLSEDGVVVTHERHKIHLVEASSAIERGMDGLRMGRFPELVAVDLMEALESLGAIIGEKVEEEILDRIFSEFCIGK